jgi:hypothetical protein
LEESHLSSIGAEDVEVAENQAVTETFSRSFSFLALVTVASEVTGQTNRRACHWAQGMAGAGRLQPRSWNVEFGRPIGLSDQMLPPALDPAAILGNSDAELGAVEEEPRKNHDQILLNGSSAVFRNPTCTLQLVPSSACTRERMIFFFCQGGVHGRAAWRSVAPSVGTCSWEGDQRCRRNRLYIIVP